MMLRRALTAASLHPTFSTTCHSLAPPSAAPASAPLWTAQQARFASKAKVSPAKTKKAAADAATKLKAAEKEAALAAKKAAKEAKAAERAEKKKAKALAEKKTPEEKIAIFAKASGDATAQSATPKVRRAEHPRSGKMVQFDQRYHAYSVGGKPLKSVTALLRTPLERDGVMGTPVTNPFDLEGVAAKVANVRSMTVGEVKAEWKGIADYGTKMHNYICDFLTNEADTGSLAWSEEELQGDREKKYQEAFREYYALLQKFGYQLAPCGSEMIVASPMYNLAGTIDCLMWCPEGNAAEKRPHYLIVDWKTNSKAMRSQTPFPGEPQTLNWPFESLPAVKLSDYTLQTNAYKRILETEGYVPSNAVVRMAIAQFIQNPATGEVDVDGIAIKDLGAEVDKLFEAAQPSFARGMGSRRSRMPFA